MGKPNCTYMCRYNRVFHSRRHTIKYQIAAFATIQSLPKLVAVGDPLKSISHNFTINLMQHAGGWQRELPVVECRDIHMGNLGQRASLQSGLVSVQWSPTNKQKNCENHSDGRDTKAPPTSKLHLDVNEDSDREKSTDLDCHEKPVEEA